MQMTCEVDVECEGKREIKNNSQLCGRKYWVEDVGCDFPSIDQQSIYISSQDIRYWYQILTADISSQDIK